MTYFFSQEYYQTIIYYKFYQIKEFASNLELFVLESQFIFIVLQRYASLYFDILNGFLNISFSFDI